MRKRQRMKNGFDGLLEKDREIIDKALKKYLKKEKSASGDISRAMEYALFPGGKRLRPLLCIEAARCCGEKIEDAIPAACAIEFIHNFSLVHDDLPSMDDDDFRRGKPSCHRKFGEAAAILAGDALLNIAFKTLSDIKNKKISVGLIEILSDSIGPGGMIGGQGLDIKYANKNKTGRLNSRINDLKTGALFCASLVSGAAAVSAPSRKIRRLSEFGRYFGRAFQICDDITDGKYKGRILDKRKEEFRSLMKRAKSSLDIFGKKADNLRYMADKLVLSNKL